MAVLKQIFIQLTFADWWKINDVEDQGEKLLQTIIFPSCQVAHEVLRRKNVVHIIELFLHQRTDKNRP